jgi:hydroxymethylpyrimidine/phosphomethylpyrimidine kinase
LRDRLLPLASVVTPNLPEAGALLGKAPAANEAEMVSAAEGILALGAKTVLLKGGHLEGAESLDIFHDGSEVMRLPAKRIATKNTHGTGCSLSSAIAAKLAQGRSLSEAVADAKAYMTLAIAAADELAVGRGHGPVHHFHAVWPRLEA